MATPPVPGRKPDINSASGATSILNQAWGFVSGTLERGFTYYAEKEQAERLIKLREAEARAEANKRSNYVALESAANAAAAMTGSKYVPYMMAGLIGLAGFVILKKR